ncbi:hypothetical protein BDW60DRAFT_224623 [Aspergillus nidulans var. acristatus]
MKHLAAYLLLTLGGNIEPGADDIREVLVSVGIEADEIRLAQLLNGLRGKDIHELIAEGTSKLATLGTIEGGGKPGPVTPDMRGEKRDEESVDSNVYGDDEEDEDEDFGLGLFS